MSQYTSDSFYILLKSQNLNLLKDYNSYRSIRIRQRNLSTIKYFFVFIIIQVIGTSVKESYNAQELMRWVVYNPILFRTPFYAHYVYFGVKKDKNVAKNFISIYNPYLQFLKSLTSDFFSLFPRKD